MIENEFGAVGIDDKLVEDKQHQEEQIIVVATRLMEVENIDFSEKKVHSPKSEEFMVD